MTAQNTAAQLAAAAELIAALELARRSGPPLVYGSVNNVDFEINEDGRLTLGPVNGEMAVKIPVDVTYALYIWLAKYPHVGALLERLAAERHAAGFVQMEQEDRATDRRRADRLADLERTRKDDAAMVARQQAADHSAAS